ncbi:MAG: hypothetical protein VW708_05650, partial [Ilumatobacter sp.]
SGVGDVRVAASHDSHDPLVGGPLVRRSHWLGYNISRGEAAQPDIPHGAYIQRIVDTALASAADGGRMIPVPFPES